MLIFATYSDRPLRRVGRVAMLRIANPSTSVRLRDAPPLYYQIHQCLIVLSISTVLILRVLSLLNFFIYLHKVNPFVIRYYFLKRYYFIKYRMSTFKAFEHILLFNFVNLSTVASVSLKYL